MKNQINMQDKFISKCQSLYPSIVKIIDKYKPSDLKTNWDVGKVLIEIATFVANSKPDIKFGKLDACTTTMLYLWALLIADKFQIYPARKETKNEIKYDKIITLSLSTLSEAFDYPVDALEEFIFSQVAEILN
jgi:hypothetical protein